MTYRFIVDWDVFGRLARARRILDPYFSRTLGSDGMNELERDLQDTQFWSVSDRAPSSGGPTAHEDQPDE